MRLRLLESGDVGERREVFGLPRRTRNRQQVAQRRQAQRARACISPLAAGTVEKLRMFNSCYTATAIRHSRIPLAVTPVTPT